MPQRPLPEGAQRPHGSFDGACPVRWAVPGGRGTFCARKRRRPPDARTQKSSPRRSAANFLPLGPKGSLGMAP